MCTAITMNSDHYLFGRNLDWKDSCGGMIVTCPRNYSYFFQNGQTLQNHYAMIGVAAVCDGFPLYFDAANEAGLAIAGLNFPEQAYYHPFHCYKNNLAPYELIPWLLCKCRSVAEAQAELESINVWAHPFSDTLPLTPLHWIIADQRQCIVVESTLDGLQVYDNPYGVLTNSPPFPYHATHIRQFLGLSNQTPQNKFSAKLELKPYSYGMGAIGLPGDPSSPSRFVRAAFIKWNSPSYRNTSEQIIQFFQILKSVMQQKGVTRFPDGDFEYTVYSGCCDVTDMIYYYTTYHTHAIHAVSLKRTDLEGTALVQHPLVDTLCIHHDN